ncbi:MAG: hypothetical protein UX17_C0007G0009 [Parcubacteria group bacterium GW2011_GWC2_45_7]|nr:MAG: hypothetical protein UX17_C0007G0009 [Parcubacteria group bacterium GW2011_GWC2_45_7]KKU73827.1 MAG: hypothetical protein UX98_C0004G0026 [Parcubacteria group bacterium GW2011_GWA2_47_26]
MSTTAVLLTAPELVPGVSMSLQVLRYLAEGKLTVKAVLRGREHEGPIEGYVHNLDWYKGRGSITSA